MPLLDRLDIVNSACAMIGEAPLQSLEDEIDAGQSAALLYDATFDFNIGIGNFAFSKKIVQLSRDDVLTAAGSYAGYDFIYTLSPERVGDPLYLTDDPTDKNRRFSAYDLIGNEAHSDAEALWAMIRYRAEPYRWTGPFKLMHIKAMAAELAIPLAHDRALAEDLRRQAYGTAQENYRGGLMRAALSAEAFTQPPRTQDRDNNPLTAAMQS